MLSQHDKTDLVGMFSFGYDIVTNFTVTILKVMPTKHCRFPICVGEISGILVGQLVARFPMSSVKW